MCGNKRVLVYPDDDVIRKGLSEEQLKSCVYHVRQKYYGAFLLGRLEVPPLSKVEGKPLSFFQFHQSGPRSDLTANPDRMIGWAHPELRQLLLYNGVSQFLDGTFRCVPTEFKQCMVLMVHDQASDLFVPAYFVLCTSKTRDMYLDTLELIERGHPRTRERFIEFYERSSALCKMNIKMGNTWTRRGGLTKRK